MKGSTGQGPLRLWWSVLPVLLALHCFLQKGDAACDGLTEYTCQNEVCIPLSQYNNSVNDCGDNSDEVSSPCKPPSFTCTSDTGKARCLPLEWVLDGVSDCNDQSDEAKVIGTDCTMVRDCCGCDVYVSHSVCQSGVCQCQSGYYSNDIGTVCTKRIVGDNCSLDTDCSDAFSNSSCNGGRCTCDTGFQSSDDNSICDKKMIGDSCSVEVDCTTVISDSTCRDNKCVCNYGYYPSPDHRTCVRRELGERCQYFTDCAALHGAACMDSVCACQYGFRLDPTKVVCRRRHLGDKCKKREDCQYAVKHSICQGGLCACALGYRQGSTHSQCVPRLLGDSCNVRPDCEVMIRHSNCSEGHCVCLFGYLASTDMSSCHPWPEPYDVALVTFCIAAIGRIGQGECAVDIDCRSAVNNSFCANDTCTCSTGYYVTNNNTTCTKRRMGDSCTVDADCSEAVEDSLCGENLTCECRPGYRGHQNTTCLPRRISDQCSVTVDCSASVPNATCESQTCVCPEAFLPAANGTRCHLRPTLAPYLEVVSPTPANCTGEENRTTCSDPGSLCIRGQCLCRGGFARASPDQPCQRARGYLLTLNLTSIAGRYELLPLVYNADYWSNSSSYGSFTQRIQTSGISAILGVEPFLGEYLESRVVSLRENQDGLQVQIHVFLTLLTNLTKEDINATVMDSIQRSSGEVGNSRIYTTIPLVQLSVGDLNECDVINNQPMNDCSENATCINLEGYFECICNMDYKDHSNSRYSGRNCTYEDPEGRILAIMIARSRMRCTEDVCETPWGLVSGVLTVIFVLLVGLLILEICWKKKRMVRRRIRVPVSLLLEEAQCPEHLEDTPPEIKPVEDPPPEVQPPEAPRRVRMADTHIVHQVASYSSSEESSSGSRSQEESSSGSRSQEESSSGSRSQEESSWESTSGDSESADLVDEEESPGGAQGEDNPALSTSDTSLA